MRFRLFHALLALVLIAVGSMTAIGSAAASENGAVIFLYHRFGEDDFPSTSIGLDRFADHLAELTSGRYNVISLPDIVAAFKAGTELPDRTIAVTIDDAFLSVYSEAWPRLRAAGLPFTLFVATDPLDGRVSGYMSWDQLREMASSGVTIGHHTTSHLHMPFADSERTERALAKANERFEAELGLTPTLFAYPYGEFSQTNVDLVRSAGFAAAFGQHSGVAHPAHDLYTLPRFALSDQFGELSRLILAANALPLPVSDLTPSDTVLGPNPPPLGFTVAEDIEGLNRLACYASHEAGPARIERLGDRRIEVRLQAPFPAGRGRINCTLDAGDGRWRWFGIQFLIPDEGD